MAAVLAVAYPDIFAAVGVHSGLPAGAASNVAQALMVMKRGRTSATPAISLPTIVFHGDADSTVHPHNGEQLVASARGQAPGQPQVEHGRSAQGQAYTRTLWPAQSGQAAVEYWQLHGAGHAWSGGRAEGSFTNPKGVDASAEMLRFFWSQRRGD